MTVLPDEPTAFVELASLNTTREAPTAHLRYLSRYSFDRGVRVLQQLWHVNVVNSAGVLVGHRTEWRDVPTVTDA